MATFVYALSNTQLLDVLGSLNYNVRRQLIGRTLNVLWRSQTAANAPVLSALIRIAGLDEGMRNAVYAFNEPVETIERSSASDSSRRTIYVLLLAGLVLLGALLYYGRRHDSSVESQRASGELFGDAERAPDNKQITEAEWQPAPPTGATPISSGAFDDEDSWQESVYASGETPKCFNFNPRVDNSLDNYLRVFVGSGTDVAMKLMDLSSGVCVRYVFVRSRGIFSIKHIPEGEYYVKIAYGRRWVERVENGSCTGRFASNALYEKGQDILDYRVKRTSDGVNERLSIPSFEIQLDVTTSGLDNSLETAAISEAEFNR